MAGKPHFRLKRPESDSPTAIYLDLRHKGNRLRWGTGLSIHPDLWDTGTQRPTDNRYYIKKHWQQNPALKTELENLTVTLNDIVQSISRYKQLQSGKGEEFTLSGLRSHLKEQFKPTDKSGGEQIQMHDLGYLTEYIEKHIDDMEHGRWTTSDGSKYAASTINTFKRFRKKMKAYEEKLGYSIRLEDIDMDFYNGLVKHYQDQGLSQNYIGRIIKDLKVILRRSHHDGVHDNTVYIKSNFRTLKTSIETIYLTEEEVRRLYDLDLSGYPYIERETNVFLVGCYTALRYSDFSRIKPDYIIENGGNKFIRMQTRKTGQRVVIPVRSELAGILEEYNYELPKTHRQKVNDRIKEAAKMAGIDDQVNIEKYEGGEKVERTVPKYSLITTHTARRTGATLMYKAGIPTLDIMKITGHKTERNFLKYIRITEEEAAQRMAKHPYFKGNEN